MTATGARVLQTADNALRALILLGASEEPRSLAEIARELSLAKSVAYNLMFTLTRRGFAHQDAKSRRYSLGLQLVSLGNHATQRLDLRRVARTHMQLLATETSESAYLMVPGRNMCVLLDRIDPPNPLKVTMEVGQEGYLHAGSSNKAILAFLPDEEINRIIEEVGLPSLAHLTPTTPDALWEQIRAIRAQGWAYTEEESFEGIAGLAAPIFDWQGKVVGSVGIAGLIQRLRPRTDLLALHVKEIAKAVSRDLGFDEGDR